MIGDGLSEYVAGRGAKEAFLEEYLDPKQEHKLNSIDSEVCENILSIARQNDKFDKFINN